MAAAAANRAEGRGGGGGKERKKERKKTNPKHHAGSGNWENIKRDLLSIKSNKSLKMKLSCVSVLNPKVKV